MNVKDKIFVVTGGGNGIGREIVLTLLDQGAKLAALDINQKALEETLSLANKHKDKISIHVANITDRKTVEALPEQIIKAHGAIDGLINNAGIIQPFKRLEDLDFQTIERVFQVNFFGALNMTKTFLPYLQKRPEAYLVNVSSMGGFFPFPGQTIYGASKAAVKLMTEGLYAELLGSNVHVSVVIPGGIETDIMNNSGVEGAKKAAASKNKIKMTTPQQAAAAIVKGIRKNKYKVLIGQDAKFMNFIYKFSPKRAIKAIKSIMEKVLPEE